VAIALYEKINDKTLKVGYQFAEWTTLSVGKEIKIGCHNFKTSYLLKFGSELKRLKIAL